MVWQHLQEDEKKDADIPVPIVELQAWKTGYVKGLNAVTENTNLDERSKTTLRQALRELFKDHLEQLKTWSGGA